MLLILKYPPEMPKKVKYELDFDIEDRVFFVTDADDETPAIITQIILSKTEACYMVSRGMDEKICYAFEIREAKPDA